jgi:hypothetical protein
MTLRYELVAGDHMLARGRFYCYQGVSRGHQAPQPWSIVISINVLWINHNVPPP